MKKIFTILSIIAVLLSGTTIRYSAHYCNGFFIDSRLSLSGKNASCGMTHEDSGGKDLHFSNIKCENEISSFTFSEDYVHAPQVYDAGKSLAPLYAVLINPPVITSLLISSLNSTQIPPGNQVQKCKSEILCVFRI